MKAENSFILQLEQKAKEQKLLVKTEIMPEWAKGIGGWLTVNPWRVIIPISALAYCILRTAYGYGFREFVLGLFGGFA
jgi:hypothetical protein